MLKNSRSLSSLGICRANTRVRDPPKCYKVKTSSKAPLGPQSQDTLRPALFTGMQIRSGVFYLSTSRLRLPDTGAEEAQLSRLVADTGVLKPRWPFLHVLTVSRGLCLSPGSPF